MNNVAVVAATRTPIGSFQGIFATITADHLGAITIAELLRHSPRTSFGGERSTRRRALLHEMRKRHSRLGIAMLFEHAG